MSDTNQIPRRLLRLPAVIQKVGLGRDSIYRLARARKFPRPIKLSERASAWDEAEVDAWMAERIAASRSEGAVTERRGAA